MIQSSWVLWSDSSARRRESCKPCQRGRWGGRRDAAVYATWPLGCALAAAQETSAILLGWTAALLAAYPEVQVRPEPL
jgi:hypothetical protein